MKEIKFEFF